jgi:hypothetical protein
MYTAFADAYVDGSIRAGKVKRKGSRKVPWYLRSPEKAGPGLTGQALWDAVDRMKSRLDRGPSG